eukprot:5062046-Pleurochrysis_carterae.AAC.1
MKLADEGAHVFVASKGASASAAAKTPISPPGVGGFEVGAASRVRKGEDTYNFCSEVIGGERVIMAMVADGHGGGAAALFCRDHLLGSFIELARGDPSAESLQAAGRGAFRRAHAEVRSMRDCTAGCTLTLCAFNERRAELTCLNAGDALAYIFLPGQPGAVELVSEDHRLDRCATERARLRAVGGTLGRAKGSDGQPAGPIRVFPGGLA